jgi:hypothetical protein
MLKTCRFCKNNLEESFCDLGKTPLSNSYLSEKELHQSEQYHPLHAFLCTNCFLVQLLEYETPQNIFSDYAYFSSYSDSWLKQCQEYVDNISSRLKLSKNSFVIEIASNDGYLLQYFLKKEIPVLGIEPAKNVAQASISKKIPTLIDFFGTPLSHEIVKKYQKADLIIANNVFAHVPDLNDFVSGMSVLLKETGVITIEVPHLKELIENNQFDTIYHEHFSYFSLYTLEKVFKAHNLRIFDVEKLSSHGGSLRIYGCKENALFKESSQLTSLRKEEKAIGVDKINTYRDFFKNVKKIKFDLINFLIEKKKENKSIIGYGAPAKGNTLLNYCGIRTDFIDYTVDKNPYKVGRFLPGSHIPINDISMIEKTKPDYILILPWNIKNEIISQLSYTRKWGAKFVIPIPSIEVI